jgi:hypothetical protein
MWQDVIARRHIADPGTRLKAFGDNPRLHLIRPAPLAPPPRLNDLAPTNKSIATIRHAKPPSAPADLLADASRVRNTSIQWVGTAAYGQAAIVARIFREYDAGHSARTIAAGLNADGIPSPESGKGGDTWGPSTISGNWKRGTGILNNELYIGRLVWNRQTFVKDPDTQKRQARLNPAKDWVIEAVPDLQIIDEALWDRVKARQAGIRMDMNPAGVQNDRPTRPENARRPSYLFSGLLKCGCCGTSYTLINKTRYGCVAARNKGEAICTNRATIEREVVEDRVLTGLRDTLLHPDLIATFVEEYRRAFNAEAAGADAAREKARRDLTQIDKKINGILAAIEDGMYQPSMKDRMAELEGEKVTLTCFLAESPEPPALRLHPSLSDLYRTKIRNLSSALQDPGLKMEATEALRGLVSEIRMVPDADAPNGHHIELAGELAGILALGEAQTTKPAASAGLRSVTMVAGARLQKYLPLYGTRSLSGTIHSGLRTSSSILRS